MERLEPCGELVPRCTSEGLQGRAWLVHGEGLAVPAMGASTWPHGCVFRPFTGKWGCRRWPWRLPELQVLCLQFVDLSVHSGVQLWVKVGSTFGKG